MGAPANTSAAELASAAASASPRVVAAAMGSAATTDRLVRGVPRRVKSIGHTSYVLKVALDNGAVGVFKPRSKKPLGDRRYKGEIAAYRLAEALGLNHVPRAITRTFRVVDLRSALPSESQAEFDGMVRTSPGGDVEGALTVWIEGYEVLPLESSAWRSRWMPWLTNRQAEIAPPDKDLAREISTLIAFDCLTANWDRWSGGNVARDRSTGNVLFVDNDGAFYDDPPTAALEQQFKLLGQVLRFSRGFILALRTIDLDTLRIALGEDERGGPLLPDRNIAAADTRRHRILQIVDATIERDGASQALTFD